MKLLGGEGEGGKRRPTVEALRKRERGNDHCEWVGRRNNRRRRRSSCRIGRRRDGNVPQYVVFPSCHHCHYQQHHHNNRQDPTSIAHVVSINGPWDIVHLIALATLFDLL
jgi:hypothetical protein